MKMPFWFLHVLTVLVLTVLVLAGCASKNASPGPANTPAPATDRAAGERSTDERNKTVTPFTGAGHDYATAIQFSDINNPIAFSQKQQEWLWLNYRDWKKQGQSLRESNGVQYDEVRLSNGKGETRVIYFRMPKGAK
ncbi:hypothetical protein HPT27_04720 [Permianibacter sp. IMCC34836]|uniref:hypothetical protein n=1 Tax=Permianibacter fluminis TaxID=2738515 RepID=UPI00155229FE|nr:hypothetical protein [Permianibacter fluminis]NQD36319.1 hypothetical protein [Permianibacter fluminis]